MKSHYYKKFIAVFFAAGVLAAPAAFAITSAVQFNFGQTGSPAMTALFQDVAPGQVQLTIDAVNLNGNNSLNALCFNLNPLFDAKDLSFTQKASVGGVQGSVSSANDSYKVIGGGGKFDISFMFGSDFQTGDSVTYSITGIPGLSVNDFLYLETASAGHTPGYAAGSIQQLSGLLIVQGSPQQGSPNSSAAPDVSSTMGLLIMSMVAVGFLAKRHKLAAKV